MNKRNAGRCAATLMVLVISGLLFWIGCSKDLMSADESPPLGTRITNPSDGAALSSQIIDIRGRAEVGATVDIIINGVFDPANSAVAWPDGQGVGLGRFTVEDVDLGEEGEKVIEAIVTDLYGNRAATPVVISVSLDMTAPPIAFEDLWNAQWDSLEGRWTTGAPRCTVICRSDETASGARVRYGINDFRPDSIAVVGDTVRYRIPMTAPPLSPADPDSLAQYWVEAFDNAGNVSSEPLTIYWAAAGKETVLSWDDGHPNFIQNNVTGQNGMQLAVFFKAPPWANFITGAEFYIMNDNQTNPSDPEAPSTRPFRIWVWRPTTDERPGVRANDGFVPCNDLGCYPEAELVGWDLPNAIDITNYQHFPDKTFFLGMEWLYRNNPYIGLDPDDPIDSRSFRYNWTTWDMLTLDAIVHARVSDLQITGGGARTAVLKPVGVGLVERRDPPAAE